MGLLSNLFRNTKQVSKPKQVNIVRQTPKPITKTENLKVAGISYREKAVKELAVENSNYNCTKKELLDSMLTNEKYISMSSIFQRQN